MKSMMIRSEVKWWVLHDFMDKKCVW
jgi:hypothetical protein